MKIRELPLELISIMDGVGLKATQRIESDLIILKQSDYDNLFWAIFSPEHERARKSKSRTHSAIELLTHLNNYIVAHRNKGEFAKLNLRNPIQLRRPKPPLRQGNLQLLPLLEQCDKKLLLKKADDEHAGMAPDGKPQLLSHSDWTLCLGRLLYCAMRFGGLLRGDLQSELLRVLLQDKPYCHQDVIWFELTGQAGETHLWLPDPVSLLLINAFFQAKQHILQVPALPQQPEKYIRTFLRHEGHAELAGMTTTAMRELILARLSLHMTPCLLGVMSDSEPNLTLDPVSFYRLLGGRYPVQEAIVDDTADASAELSAQISTVVRTREDEKRPSYSGSLTSVTACADVMKDVRDILRGAAAALQSAENASVKTGTSKTQSTFSGLKDASQQIASIANNPDLNLLPVTRELISWASHRLVMKSHWSGRIRPKSLLSFLGTIFEPLSRRFQEQRIELLSAESLDEAYVDIIDGASSSAGKTKRARVLRDFHIYLMKIYGLAQSYVFTQAIVKGERNKAVLVDANILLPAEYARALAYLADQDNDVAKAQSLLLILGFRSGLRRSEAYMLRLQDFEIQRDDLGEWIASSVVVVVNPHEERGLKSDSATRRVPLGLLASADEIQLLFDFMQSRPRKASGPQYLFSQKNKYAELYPDDQLFNGLVQVLQIITDDDTFRFHRLRHSFATWLFWSWQADKYPHAFPLKTQLQHPVMAHLAMAKAQYFQQLQAIPSRKTLHAISLMTGHSGPSITTFHYLHSMHWAVVAEFWRDSHFPREREIELLGLHRRTVFRHLEQGHLAGLVAKQLQPFCHAIPEDPPAQQLEEAIHLKIYGHADSRFYQALHYYQNNFKEISLKALEKKYLVDIDRLKAAVDAWQVVVHAKPMFGNCKSSYEKGLAQLKKEYGESHSDSYSDSDGHGDNQDENKILHRPHVRVPIWPRHRRDAAVALQILAMYQKLTAEEQSMVLAAASYVVWVCPGKFSDIRFFYKNRLVDFVENIKPIVQQLEPRQKIKLSLRNKAEPDAWLRKSLMKKRGLNLRMFKRMLIRHPQYLFIENRYYVSLNLTRVIDSESLTPRNSGYGLKTALIGLYYLHCRDNPHIEFYTKKYSREVPTIAPKETETAQASKQVTTPSTQDIESVHKDNHDLEPIMDAGLELYDPSLLEPVLYDWDSPKTSKKKPRAKKLSEQDLWIQQCYENLMNSPNKPEDDGAGQ